MQVYSAPLRDMRFVLHELHAGDGLLDLPGFEEFSPELIDTVLEEAAKLAKSVLLPLNASGDEEGCRIENGVVRTPGGFKEAYRQFRDGGWPALACDPAYGGQGFPESVSKLIEEMNSSANFSFGLFPMLSHGAYQAVHAHGSDELKARYLPKIVDGIWTGTMCLTEAHCGTDLGLMRTRAVPQSDGSYRITGSKIFITAGEHDLSENIIHLVLARMPDAPAGIKGVSLFLVPKFLPTEDGRPGARNGVTCTALEHKMGARASPTCQLNFDDATGWLVGEPNKGMRGMFTMMNSERLSVGVQGLGIAEIAYQSAVAYARERLQGRAAGGAKHPEQPADPIIVHADVRRMLLRMRAYAEGCRALGSWVARELDRAERSADPEARRAAADFTALLTPVVKALFSDLGYEAASLAVQVYGGHGYVRDHGVEQFIRDARIAMIYEGTNGVQAMDLVGRKVLADDGRLLQSFIAPVEAFIAVKKASPDGAELVAPLEAAFAAWRRTTDHLRAAAARDPEEIGAAASDYLRLFGLVALGFMWVRMADVAAENAGDATTDAEFYRTKQETARFFIDRVLPEAGALAQMVCAGKSSLMAIPSEAF